MIFHLALAEHIEAAQAEAAQAEAAQRSQPAEYRWSTIGVTLEQEGFIHASYADQVRGVAERYYRGVTDPLVLLAVDETRLPLPVRVEGGFPHVYGPIPLAAVVAQVPVALGADGVPDVDAALAALRSS